MRLLHFLPLYAGVFLAAGFVMPVCTAPRGSGVSASPLESFPSCWIVHRTDHYSGSIVSDTFALGRERSRQNPGSTVYRAAYDQSFELAWAPAQGDSFDIALHHSILRFARVSGPTVGREYATSSPSLVMALLAEPQFRTGEAIPCPQGDQRK